MNPVISELQQADIPQACQLFQEVFGAAISPAQWRWKYQEGPRLGSLNLVARTVHGALVGHFGAVAFPGVVGGRSVAMVQTCDMMVHPLSRGGLEPEGIYSRLMDALRVALRKAYPGAYVYGFAGSRPAKLAQRLGYYRALYKVREGGYVGPVEPSHSWALQLAPDPEWDAERLDKLWGRYGRHSQAPLVTRNGAYLHWRYRDKPNHTYQLWILKQFWRDTGWMVSATDAQGKVVLIDAMLSAAVRPEVALARLWFAINGKRSQPTSPLTHWLMCDAQTSRATPHVTGEFRVDQWHTEFKTPNFQPGDTDVF